MSESCNILNVKPIRVSELASYSSLKSNDLILVIQKNGSNLYSRKTTFSDFVKSITSLTASLSGNIKGEFTGNLIGNVVGYLTGGVTGSFSGTISNTTGSIIGIPYKKINNLNISFDGTSTNSIYSNNSITASYSNNTFSSSFAITSSYVSSSYSNISISSSYSNTSSVSLLSSISVESAFSDKSINCDRCDYALNGKHIDSSRTTTYSDFTNSSSYSISTDFVKTSSFSIESISSSFSKISKTSKKYPKNKLTYFDMVYFSTFSGVEDGVYTNPYDNDTLIFQSGTNQFKVDNKWYKIELANAIQKVCGVEGSGKIPEDTEFIDVLFLLDNEETGEDVFGKILWSADHLDINKPKFTVDIINFAIDNGKTWTDFRRTRNMILPIKPGNPPSFSIKAIHYNGIRGYIRGYYKSKTC